MLKRLKSELSDRRNFCVELLSQTATPFSVLLLGLVLTGLAWHQTSQTVERDAQINFERHVSEAKNSLDFRLQTYINTLKASQGLYAASQSIERNEWKTFVESLKLQKRYPGIAGIGFIRYVSHSQKASYEQRVRQDISVDKNGYPDFAIKPTGDRRAYFVIEYIEPLLPNRPSMGLDVGFDPVRRAAVERARDTGEAAATGQIVLVQDATGKPGLLILLPVYRNGIPHNTVEEKRRALLGFIYAPIRAENLIEEALPNARQQDLELEAYNGKHLMYRSDRVLQLRRLKPQSLLQKEITLDVAGQKWELAFLTQRKSQTFLAPTPILVLSSGTLISLLLFGILWSLTSSRQRALKLATQMTADLRTSENLLRDFFNSASDLIQSVSLENKFIFVNQAWQKNLGYSEEEIGQLSLMDILHPDSRESFLETLKALLAGEPRQGVETTFITKDGTAIAVEGNINCRFENGLPQVVRGIFRNISERKRVEALLQQSYDELELRVKQRTAELEAEIADRTRAEEEIRLLQIITKAITEAPNFEQAVAVTLKKVCRTIGWNFAEAWLPDPQDRTLQPSPAWYGSIDRLHYFREASLDHTFSRNTGVPGRVWATKQPEWTKDVSEQTNETFLRSQIARQVGLKAALGVPIIADEKVIAVFVFFTFDSREEDKRMVDVVKSVAKQLGLFIERKRAEDALRSSMATNRALINAIPDWLLRIDKNGMFVNFKAAKDAPLLPHDELLGKHIDEVFPCEVAQPILNCVEQAMTTAEVQILECQLPTDDRWRDYEVRLAVSAEDEVMAIVRDITQRKRSEQELKQQKNLMAALLDNIPDVAWLKDREGRFIAVNEPFCQVCGLDRHEILGYTDFEIFMPEFAQKSLEYDLEVMQSGQRKYIEEVTFKSQNDAVWIETIITPIYDLNCQTIGTTGISRDITERKRKEEDMHNALEKEKQLNELKSRFVAMTSHEFRTPLATILSSAELIEYYGHKWSEQKKQQYLQKIQASVKHMTNLLNDVLVLGKAEAGKVEFMPTEIEIEQFCRELVEEVQLSTSSHTIYLQVQPPCAQASLDEKLLRHILTNILTNAIKYSPQSDRVDFELICQCHSIIFRIRDYGIGIPQSEQDKLFDSFHRASNVGNISGTGLGLAIVKKSVDLHGGTIEMSSQVGVGTTFSVTLPLTSN